MRSVHCCRGIRYEMGMAQPVAVPVPGNQFGDPLGICRGGRRHLTVIQRKTAARCRGWAGKGRPPPALTVKAPSVTIHRMLGSSWSLAWAG